MLFLLDTCALNHIRELFEHRIVDLRKILPQFHTATTNAVVKEWVNYELDLFFPTPNCHLIPVPTLGVDRMNSRFPFFRDFDKADQTLLWTSLHESSVIISDDGGLIAAALSIGKKALFLPDFCIFLVKDGFLSKNIMRKALKFWETKHRYNLADIKRWHQSLNRIT